MQHVVNLILFADMDGVVVVPQFAYVFKLCKYSEQVDYKMSTKNVKKKNNYK